MIRTVIDVQYIHGVRRSFVSLSELDLRGYEIQIRVGFMEILRGDMAVIRGTKRDGLYEMVGLVESASTVVPTDAPTWRVIGADDMTDCGKAAIVEAYHMTVSAIAQLSGQRVAGGGRFDRLDFLGRLRTDGGRRGYAVGDAVWGIGSVRPRAMDSCLMQ
jgi:hypothetical protein